MNPELFFDPDQWPTARAVCRTCPVQDECLAYALATREVRGLWGGLSPAERGRLARGAPAAAQPGPARALSDAELVAVLNAAAPGVAAFQAIQAATGLGRSSVFEYLRRARRLGAVERRGPTLYPRSTPVARE
jgi:WhiB family redox-sensing transcriptional regulator